MPTWLHGWGSDGINPSGCPTCAEMDRNDDKRQIVRLRAALERLRGWDMVSPPQSGELEWVKRVIEWGLSYSNDPVP